MRRILAGLAMLLAVHAAAPAVAVAAPPAAADQQLSLLSYNVEGLSWPVATKRGHAAAAIAQELKALRARGAQPHVVAVQEAFRDAAKSIGARAGYAYAAYGPAEDMPGAAATLPQDRNFAAAASLWHGERLGKYADSGLAVFSDYPILWVRRTPFPAYACAGWDCLANKGLLAVALRVPGHAEPVVVVDTHLNSRGASGVDKARSFYAYRRQVDALVRFVAGDEGTGASVLLAGDFNIGNDRARAGYIGAGLATLGMRITAAEQVCGTGCRRLAPVAAGGGISVEGDKTLLAYRSAAGSSLSLGRAEGFGRRPGGGMLSDHIGVEQPFARGA